MSSSFSAVANLADEWECVMKLSHLRDIRSLACVSRSTRVASRRWRSYSVLVVPKLDLTDKLLPRIPPFEWHVCDRQHRAADDFRRAPYCVVRQLYRERTGEEAGETHDEFAALCMEKGSAMLLPWSGSSCGVAECAVDENVLLQALPGEDEIAIECDDPLRTHALQKYRTCGYQVEDEHGNPLPPRWWSRPPADDAVVFTDDDGMPALIPQIEHQKSGHRAWWLWMHTLPQPQRRGALRLLIPAQADKSSHAAFMHAGGRLLQQLHPNDPDLQPQM
jgi:hypothetical protein